MRSLKGLSDAQAGMMYFRKYNRKFDFLIVILK